MKHRERRREICVAKVFVKLGKLPGREQTFINYAFRRQRTDITAWRQNRFRAFAQQRQLPLKIRRRLLGLHIKLPNLRHAFARARAEGSGIDRNTPPAEHFQLLRFGSRVNCRARLERERGGKKCEAQSKCFGQLKPLFFSARAKKCLRQRSEQACSIAAGAVGVHTTTVRQALKRGQRVVHDVVRRSSAQTRHEPRPARIVIRVTPVRMASHTPL